MEPEGIISEAKVWATACGFVREPGGDRCRSDVSDDAAWGTRGPGVAREPGPRFFG